MRRLRGVDEARHAPPAQNKTPAGRQDRAGVGVVAVGEQIMPRQAMRDVATGWPIFGMRHDAG